MGILSNKHQNISKEELASSLKASWKGITALILFFVAIALGVRWLTHDSPSLSNSSTPEVQIVINELLVKRIASNYRLSSQHVRSLMIQHHHWTRKRKELHVAIDSVNQLMDQLLLSSDTLTNLKFKALELDILATENSTSFYNSMQMGLSREHSIEIITLLNEVN